MTLPTIARKLFMPLRTLQDWRRKKARGQLAASPVGRPVIEATAPQRDEVQAALQESKGRVGVEPLRRRVAGLARAEISKIKSRWLAEERRGRREALMRLCWHVPGSVWAADYTKPDQLLPDGKAKLLVVKDLASSAALESLPTRSENEEELLLCMEALFDQHGAPLVLKHDNGPGFRSIAFQGFLRTHGVQPLPSPPRTPRYNGAVEHLMGPLKDYAAAHAEREGHPARLESRDLSHSRKLWNGALVHGAKDGNTRWELFSSRPAISASERIALQRAFTRHLHRVLPAHGHAELSALDEWERGRMIRASLPSALVELGYLTIRRA